jgi:hypothetical protein
MLIVAFAVAASTALFVKGQQQQFLAQHYGQAQEDLREALRPLTRTMRHGFQIVPTTAVAVSGCTCFATTYVSDVTQVVVVAPQPDGTSPPRVEIRFYVDNAGNLIEQRADSPATLTTLLTGVTSQSFSYYKTTSAGAQTSQGSTPDATTTQVQLTVTAQRTFGQNNQSVHVQTSALVNLRNAIVAMNS